MNKMGNKISIEGNGNIVIQDLNNGTISINSSDTEALKKYFDKATSDIKEELLKVLSHLNIQISTNFKTDLPKHLTIEIPTLSKESIIGRSKELNGLHQMLFDNKMIVVMNGMGGIGKTTLAQVYIHEYSEEYQHIAWISHNFEDITLDFANAKGLVENLEIKKEISETQEIFNEIFRKLKLIDKKPNLLIIDNADESIEKIRYSLPQQPNWHILITSRHELNGFSIKNLEFLSKEEALSLFKTHYLRNDLSDLQIIELIDLVDCHTLTIEILAKTAMIQRYSFEKLNLVIIDNAKSNVKINRPGTDKIERITSFLCFIFNLSDLNENELWLLKQFVCLPPEFHNYKLLFDLINPDKSQKEEIFAETLELLMQNGWLLKNRYADSYKMHRVIIEVVKRQISIEFNDINHLIKGITQKIEFNETIENPVDKLKWLPFGTTILPFLIHEDSLLIKLEDNIGLVLMKNGKYDEAKQLFESAYNKVTKMQKNKAISISRLQSHLGIVLQELGDYLSAKNMFHKSLETDRLEFGEEHPVMAVRYTNLALLLRDLGEFEDARLLIEKSVKIDELNYGLNHPFSIASRINLAIILQNFGEFEKAKNILEKNLKKEKEIYGSSHPNTALGYYNLATVLIDLGMYNRAYKLLNCALDIDIRNFGEYNSQIALCLINMAIIKKNLGDNKKAIELAEKSLSIFLKVLPEDHPNIKKAIEILEEIKQTIT
jgi:tetratricopeptide (TPR) repeat protein